MAMTEADPITKKLISLIKDRPALYKYDRRRQHIHKDLIIRQWNEVSSEMGCSEADCKIRWKSLRGGYSRQVRDDRTSKQRTTNWYLNDELSFLKDYIKTTNCNLVTPDPGSTETDSSCSQPSDEKFIEHKAPICPETIIESKPNIDMQIINDPLMNVDETKVKLEPIDNSNFDHTISEHESYLSSTLIIKSSPVPFEERIEESIMEDRGEQGSYEAPSDSKDFISIPMNVLTTVSNKSSPIPFKERTESPVVEVQRTQSTGAESSNANKLFLTSLLPDMNKLSAKKQRLFKRELLELMELLHDDANGTQTS